MFLQPVASSLVRGDAGVVFIASAFGLHGLQELSDTQQSPSTRCHVVETAKNRRSHNGEGRKLTLYRGDIVPTKASNTQAEWKRRAQ